ncbi:hypothetical protein [Pyrococcus sp. NA2]|uniref:hypothetical protein n=1 Tax=Pyrococcus sp. (strain NA2) TaxID=342949 RepID=UPI000A04FE94|nr:hypothetical protein [Pyrococcus sp. NA2]
MIARERLIRELELIDEKAMLMNSSEIDLYLIGGGNLALRGIKPATADIDVVVKDHRTLMALENVLINPSPKFRTSGGLVVYLKVFGHEYEKKLGADAVYQKVDPEMGDFNLDVFVKRVMRGIQLSEGAVVPEEFQKLKSSEFISSRLRMCFLFKGVTSLGRSKDIDDILRLLELGVYFDVVLTEIEVQRKLLEVETFERLMYILFKKIKLVQKILEEKGVRSRGLDYFIDQLKGYLE